MAAKQALAVEPLGAKPAAALAPKRKRLVYFINAFDRGGAELGLRFLAQNGFFEPFDARVVALCNGQGEIAGDLEALGLRVEALFAAPQMTTKHMALALPRLAALLKKERPDIFMLSLPQANIVGRLAACLVPGSTVISFEHNTHLSRRLFELLYLLLSPRVRMMFADCEKTARVARRRLYLGRRLPTVVVPLCSFPQEPARRPGPVPSIAKHAKLVSVGRLTRTKNHRSIIEAVAFLAAQGRSVEVEIFGEGPLRGELEALAQARGIARLVRFRGFVPNWWEHTEANLFVHTSLHEGLCIVALEAMWAGIPVVAPRVGGIADYGTDTNMITLPDVSADSVARAVAAAMERPGQVGRCAELAFADIRRRFSAAIVRRRLRNIAGSLGER